MKRLISFIVTYRKKIFKTPVGMDYLKKLRDVVIKSGNYKAEDIMPIPVKTTGHMEKSV